MTGTETRITEAVKRRGTEGTASEKEDRKFAGCRTGSNEASEGHGLW